MQGCAVTLEKWAEVMGYSSLIQTVQDGKVYDPNQKKTIVETIKHLVSENLWEARIQNPFKELSDQGRKWAGIIEDALGSALTAVSLRTCLILLTIEFCLQMLQMSRR